MRKYLKDFETVLKEGYAKIILIGNETEIVSKAKELFPEPETPVTAINLPSGISTLTRLRLFSSAPITWINSPFPSLRTAGTSMLFLPER